MGHVELAEKIKPVVNFVMNSAQNTANDTYNYSRHKQTYWRRFLVNCSKTQSSFLWQPWLGVTVITLVCSWKYRKSERWNDTGHEYFPNQTKPPKGLWCCHLIGHECCTKRSTKGTTKTCCCTGNNELSFANIVMELFIPRDQVDSL